MQTMLQISTLLLTTLGFMGCASDVAVEEEPMLFTAALTDTLPPDTAPAPTPYGMVIEQPAKPQLQAKGGGVSEELAPALAAQTYLTGRWVNTEDPLEQVAFTPSHYTTYFDGELLVEEDMQFYGQCPDACSGGEPTGAPCFTVSGPARTDCYHIVRISEDVLELQMLGVSTETIVYRKADR